MLGLIRAYRSAALAAAAGWVPCDGDSTSERVNVTTWQVRSSHMKSHSDAD